VGAPAGLLILMRLEAVAARELEVDLVLEEDRGLLQQARYRAQELVAVAQRGEPGVERASSRSAAARARPDAEDSARNTSWRGPAPREPPRARRSTPKSARFLGRRRARARPRSRRARTPLAAGRVWDRVPQPFRTAGSIFRVDPASF